MASSPVVDEHRPDLDADARAIGRGLDRLSSGRDAVATSRTIAGRLLPPTVATLTFLLIWQIVVWAKVQPPHVLPGPREVGATMVDLARSGKLAEALWTSGSRAVLGFGASLVIGTALGVVLARVRLLRTAFGPLVSALQAMPAVAWVPAAIIAFGLTDEAIYAVVLLGAVPSVTNGLLTGVDQASPVLLRAGQVLGARGVVLVRHVLFPAAVPAYLAGVRQAWAFAWRSLMAAELIAFSPDLGLGIGQLLEQGRSLFDMPVVISAMILVLVVGLAVEGLVFGPLERRVLRRRGLTGR